MDVPSLWNGELDARQNGSSACVKSAAGLKEYIEEGLAPSQYNYFVA